MWKANKIPRQGIYVTYIGCRRPPEGEETLRPPQSDLRSPGTISRLDEPPRSRWEFSQKVRERTTWRDQVSVNKAHTLFSKVVFIPQAVPRGQWGKG